MSSRGVLVSSLLLLLCSTPAAGFVVGATGARRGLVRRTPLLRACAVPPPDAREARAARTVFLASPHTDLMAAVATTKVKKKKGIRHVQIGETRIDFAHDMTQSFMWSGLMLGLAIAKVVKMGTSAWRDEPNYKHVARTEAEETELHEFCCENCGYTMFPARGREGKFFPKNFKCPSCDAPQESFFDLTDLSDPRTIKAMEEDEDFDCARGSIPSLQAVRG